MSKLVVWENLTLDGVMQAPARPDEDTRGGFQRGGWALPYGDPVMGSVIAEGMSRGGGAFVSLRLIGAKTTTTGVVIATYRST